MLILLSFPALATVRVHSGNGVKISCVYSLMESKHSWGVDQNSYTFCEYKVVSSGARSCSVLAAIPSSPTSAVDCAIFDEVLKHNK